MGFGLAGYVLEKPRIGGANSPFTASPDNLISDPGAYNAVFGLDETSPGRVEYLTLVVVDGDLPNAEFGWVKNESAFQRFDFDGAENRFVPLKGSKREDLNKITPDANTTRLKVKSPPPFSPSIGPYRIAVGSIGSGTTFPITIVANDGAFGSPAVGTVELSSDTGNLNWNPADIVTYNGEHVFFQRQTLFTSKETNGILGIAGTDDILLNPIPGLGVGGNYQSPNIRFGFGLWLTPIDVATEGAFSFDPVQGTFEWARDTGLVKFNSTDLANNNGEPVYYDGVLFERAKRLAHQDLGTVAAPSNVSPLPSEGADLVFRALPTFITGSATFSDPATLNDGSAAFQTNGVKPGDVAVLTGGPYAGARRSISEVPSETQLKVAPAFPSVDAASYRIEKGIIQFPGFSRVSTFDALGKAGQVQVNNGSGAVQFSTPDVAAYGAYDAEVIVGDLPLERGLSVRFFRTPVDLDAVDPSLKDLHAVYTVEGAKFADPIVGAPFVFMPVLPIDDEAYPMTYEIQQGTGVFTGFIPRLDIPNPPAGIGYTIDFDKKQFNFANRRNNFIVPIPFATGVVQLPDPLVFTAFASFELDQGLGFVPLVFNQDVLLEPLSGVITFIETDGALIVDGTTGFIATLNTLNQAGANFTASGVLNGDLLVVFSGPNKGVYTVDTVGAGSLTFVPPATASDTDIVYEIRRGKEILADRFFQEAILVDPNTKVEKVRSLGAITNSPRLNIPPEQIGVSRLRINLVFYTLTVVATDGDFTVPTSLPQGTVEVSEDTGNLNFSSADAGSVVFWVRKLTQAKDYLIEPVLGLIQVTERLLALDEMFLTYTSTEDDPPVVIEERATFLVRKELTTHPVQTSLINFNPLGREVALNPPPSVYRGGRPQDSTQVSITVTPTTSVISFQPDVLPTPGGATAITDALPHGAIVGPSERVYVDYYVYNAIGGENTTTVLKPSINLFKVAITEGESTFKAKGDQTTVFPADHVMRIGDEQTYFLQGSTYDSGTDTTTVTLLAPQVFRDNFNGPKLFVSSGPTRLTSAPFLPAYFMVETSPYDPIPRGMNKIRIAGDKTGIYQTGIILHFTNVSPLINDFYQVSGSTYDATLNRTEITLTHSTARQYTSPVLMRRSIRPVFQTAPLTVKTSAAPAIPPPFTAIKDYIRVFRQLEGQPGVLLKTPDDYDIDEAGNVKFQSPLVQSEEFSILYAKHEFINPGQLKASYTCAITPNESNGLVNQKLIANFSTFSPDSFYFRIETITNYRAEVADQYKADSSSGGGGPRTDNTAEAKLFQKGAESLFYPEGRLANEDLLARAYLKFYNDIINFLDDLLMNMDGRIVGDYDGRFKFDGTTGSVVSSFAAANNQIDDLFKISDFPIDFTPPLTPFKFLGTYLRTYEASASSRFYPTAKVAFNYTTAGLDTSAEDKAEILDLGAKKLTGTDAIAIRRFPRCRVTEAAGAGATTLTVDNTAAVEEQPGPLRKPFTNGMKIVVRNENGSYIVTQGSPATVNGVTATTLSFTPGLPAGVPAGATVVMAEADTTYRKSYRIGTDVTVEAEKGFLLYVTPYPPLDGSVPAIPAELRIQTPNSQELLQTGILYNNQLTAPAKPPGLFGQPFDDDGDQRIPLINPTYNRETAPTAEAGSKPTLLKTELAYVGAGGSIAANTTPPFVALGDLNGAADTITSTFFAPLPLIGDLVRILDGANGLTQFRRISAVSPSTITVDVPFAVTDINFNFLVTTATPLQTGTFTFISGTTVIDAGANFTGNGVKAGDTVVLTQVGHAAKLERRQVAVVNSATQLTLTQAFSNSTTPATYRVVNSLNTYSDIAGASSAATSLYGILATNSNSELNSIDAVFNDVFTDRLSPATASGNATAADTLVGIAVNFTTSGVVAGDLVYIPEVQANEGIFTIGEVVNSTTVKISDTPGFPAFPAGVSFRIVKPFGVSAKALQDLFAVRKATNDFYSSTLAWVAAVTTPVDVLVPPGVVDASYFARGYSGADLTNRETDILARQTYLDTTGLSTVDKLTASGDRLYDKRYIWIDARINLEKGILVRQSRAVSERIKNQEKVVKNLIKLLAVEG